MTFERWQAPFIGIVAGVLIGGYGGGKVEGLEQWQMVVIGGALGLAAGVVIFFLDSPSRRRK